MLFVDQSIFPSTKSHYNELCILLSCFSWPEVEVLVLHQLLYRVFLVMESQGTLVTESYDSVTKVPWTGRLVVVFYLLLTPVVHAQIVMRKTMLCLQCQAESLYCSVSAILLSLLIELKSVL